ncbi:MAG: capsular biosynthesis protein [Chitinispirillales bacterium]|nr:capsular biosynthesis protein [Chitinispirillales bacterium]
MRDNAFMMGLAEQSHSCGDTVKILVCDSTINICKSNPKAEKIVCAWCGSYRRSQFGRLPKNVEILRYGEFYTPEKKSVVESLKFDYDSVAAIKKLFYKNVKIGYGAFSSYVTLTRNLYPDINNEFKNYFNRYLKAECILIEVLEGALDKVRPDMVSLYNGRHFESRPVFEFSRSLGYSTKCYENLKIGKNKRKNFIFFENALPHNIKSIGGIIMDTWDNAELPEDEKLAIGESFFANRKASLFAGDKVYTRNQKYGAMPGGFDGSKRNIAVFTSSEDEFASIDNEYDDDQIFVSQPCGIVEILEHFKNDADIHFYVRIHPNLKKIKYKYHTSLLEYGDLYSNVTIIRARDEISSYSLMENVEKVIVFGSTIGVEACYWGKPVILLCAAFYNYLDICYKPKSVEEAFSLIGADSLPAKDKADALKYGFYSMYDRNQNFKYSVSRFDFFREVLIALNNVCLLNGIKIPVKEEGM